jgi:hypothetical protein
MGCEQMWVRLGSSRDGGSRSPSAMGKSGGGAAWNFSSCGGAPDPPHPLLITPGARLAGIFLCNQEFSR